MSGLRLPLLIVLAGSACAFVPDSGPPTIGCPVSPRATISTHELGTRAIRYSGNLGASLTSTSVAVDDIDHRDGTKGQILIYRTDSPPPSLMLRANRMDSGSKRSFSVRLDPVVPPIPWPGGGTAYAYVHTQNEAVLSEPGCWRIAFPDDSTEDAVVLKVK